MQKNLKTDYERSAELREARRQDAAVGIVRLYELAEKMTGQTIAERVASAARKRNTPPCLTQANISR